MPIKTERLRIIDQSEATARRSRSSGYTTGSTTPSTVNIAYKDEVNTFRRGQVIDLGTNEVGLKIQGQASQTSELLVLEDSDGADYVTVESNGHVLINQASDLAQLTVTPSAAAIVGQVIKLATSQTADSFLVEDATGTDLFAIDESGNIRLGTLEYAQIYTTGGSGTQTPGASYAKLTQWDSDGLSSDNMTADSANDKITIGNTGIYFVACQFSFKGQANATVEFTIYWNAVQQGQAVVARKLSGGDVGSGSFVGLVDVTSGSTDIEVWTQTTAGVVDIVEAQFVVVRIGNT